MSKQKKKIDKQISLRPEDEQLLLHLHDFVYLDKNFIEKHIYKSYTHKLSVYRRLSSLVNAGYLKLFLRQIDNSDHRPSNLYTLSKYGVELVEQMRGVAHWKDAWSVDPPPWWRHQLMIAYTVKEFQDKAAEAGLEVFQWISEVRATFEYPVSAANKTKSSIKPDGILVVGQAGGSEGLGLMIEMERSYSTRERTIRKVDQFNEFFARKEELMDAYQRKVAFDLPVTAWEILFIGGTPAKANKLLRDLAAEQSHVPILVAAKEEIDKDPFGAIYRDTRDPDTMTRL